MLSITHLNRCLMLAAAFALYSCSSSDSDSDKATTVVAPTIGSPTALELNENQLLNHQLAASGGERITFALKNTADAQLFALSSEGNLSSREPFDYEHPQDSNADRTFDLTVIATNEHELSSEQVLSVRLLDVAEHAVKVTFPTPNANIGGFQTTTVITGRLLLADGSSVTAGHGVEVFVNASAAEFDDADPSRWRVEMPITAGTNNFDVHMGHGDGAVSQTLSIDNSPILNNIALFDYDADGVYGYGFANGLNAALRVQPDGLNAEILFTYPFSYNGETRCAKSSNLVLDESNTRAIFMCEDREPGEQERRRSVMAFDYSSDAFVELVSDSDIVFWDKMAVVNSDNIILFETFGDIQWFKLESGTNETFQLRAVDWAGIPIDASVSPSYVKVDGPWVYVFNASNRPGVYRFNVNAPSSNHDGPYGADPTLYVHSLDLQFDSAAADSAVVYGRYIYYSDNGVIFAHDPEFRTTNVLSDAFAPEDPNHSVYLQLNIRPDAPGLLVYNWAEKVSYGLDLRSGVKNRLTGSTDVDSIDLPYNSQLSLSASADALMAFSKVQQQLYQVNLNNGTIELKRTYSLPEGAFQTSITFAYHWADNLAFFVPIVSWGGSTDTDAIHVFSIATDSGERTNLVDGAQLARHLGFTEGSVHLSSEDFTIDEQADSLLISSWATEGEVNYQALYWFNIKTHSVELAQIIGGPDAPSYDSYLLGSVDSASRQVAVSLWAQGGVAMLDIDTNELTPVYEGPVPYIHTVAPAIDSKRNRIIARAFEADPQGNAIWETETAVAFDTVTGEATPLFPEQSGLQLDLGALDTTVDSINDRAFMISDGLLLVVDLETGARAVVGQ